MTRSLTVTVDPAAVSTAEALRRVAAFAPVTIVKAGAIRDLEAELGGYEAAAAFLVELAGSIGKPVVVNLPTGRDTSTTMFLAPSAWSEERLRGWAAGHHEELAREFGAITRVRPNRAERRRRSKP